MHGPGGRLEGEIHGDVGPAGFEPMTGPTKAESQGGVSAAPPAIAQVPASASAALKVGLGRITAAHLSGSGR